MKIAIYSPYLDTAGGGEKYILTIAECLSKDYEVDILLDNHLYEIGIEFIKSKINEFHDLDLSKVHFIKAPLGRGSNGLKRIFFLFQYDWIFFLTDGSIFFSTAKNSIIHFQVPFTVAPIGLWGRIKLLTWRMAIYNSNFTKSYVEGNWHLKGQVIYPPVLVNLFKPRPKNKQILTVGRFFGFLKDKKHEVLIEAFKEMVNNNHLKGWSLHLAGGAGEGDKDYLKRLQELANSYKIYFYPNISLSKLAKLYGESSIYWHASGFEEDDPKKFEHFGITTVEAMSAGCIPVVINKGGLKEIVEQGKSGFLWNHLTELEDFTLKVINLKNRDSLIKSAVARSKLFSSDHFCQQINQLIQ